MPETPVTFEAAQAWLAGRVNVPTSLNSAELALSPGFPTAAKAQAFFSARVSSANILDALREQVTEIAEGRINVATARMRLKTFLAGQGIPADDVGMTAGPPPGVSEDDWIARRKITNLASTRRLNLIMRQNVGQAHAIGRREVSMHPAIEDRWPYFRYIAVQDGRARDEHGRLNNLVLRKSDPFWHTHTPPWDYNCRCDIEDTDQAEADQIGIARTSGTTITNPGTGQTFQDLPNESGYAWDITSSMGTDPTAFDWDAIKDATLRGIVRSELDEIAESATPAAAAELSPAERIAKHAADVDLSAIDDPERARVMADVLDDVYAHTDLQPLDRVGFDLPDPDSGTVDPHGAWAWRPDGEGAGQVSIGSRSRDIYTVEEKRKQLRRLREYRSGREGEALARLDADIASLQMEVDSVTLRRFDHYPEHSMWAYANREEGVIRHELGHVWHYAHEDAVIDFVEARAQAQGMDYEGILQTYGVTNRGKDSFGELMAENFGLYSGGKTEKMHPDMIELFRSMTTW